MDTLILKQLAQKELLEKFMVNFRKDGKNRRTCAYYQKRLKDFQALWDSAVEFHRDILVQRGVNSLEKSANISFYLDEDIYSEMEEHFFNGYASIEERYFGEFPAAAPQLPNQNLTVSADASVVQGRRADTIKLPRISLEKFSGDYRKWPTFFDLFRTLVHENESLADVQKLQYLKLHLTGEAENLLRHVQVTSENYTTAWTVLQDRYENKRMLVSTHLKTLFALNALVSESANGIKNLLDTTTECLQALENLKVPTNHWDVLIVHMTVQKLPPDTHALWEQSLAAQRELPSWNQLQEFLKGRFRTLEAITSKKPIVNSVHKELRSHPVPSRKPSYVSHAVSEIICPICGGQHSIRQCHRFVEMDHGRRLDNVRGKGLCMNCLGFGHLVARCPSHQRCLTCRQKHHTLLHRESNAQQHLSGSNTRSPQRASTDFQRREPLHLGTNQRDAGQPRTASSFSVTAPAFLPQTREASASDVNTFLASGILLNREVILATALVRVCSLDGKEHILRALIDQGSQVSFITEAAVQDLQLSKESVRINVSGVGQNSASHVNARVQLKLKPLNDDENIIDTSGLVLRKLTHLLPPRKIRVQDWKHIRGLELADPLFYKPGKIDLLLGAEVYCKIIQSGLIKGSPVAQKTSLGWILSGEVETIGTENTVNTFHAVTDLDSQLRQFWELEEVKTDRIWSEEERRCEEIFANSHKRLDDGRYEVQLPFKSLDKDKLLGESRSGAVTRLRHVESRFRRNQVLQRDYTECIKEYEVLGHMEKVHFLESSGQGKEDQLYGHCYLPHHAVIKEDSTTTKLRVVFDASKRTANGLSLNEVLLKGPTIQDDLATLLLNWRKYRIAFTADIEKMYRQVRVKREHTDYQRIVWRKTPEHPVSDYRLLTVTFGTKSAPYLATRVLHQLACDESHRYPMASKAVQTEFYVDDLLSGADTVDIAVEKRDQLIKLLKSGGFNLRKWASNWPRLLSDVPLEHREDKVVLNIDGAEQVKALGLYWDPPSDTLCYSLNLEAPRSSYTKRTILSDVAKLFDPLGWAAPTVIIAKVFIQKLWLVKLDWDEPIPQDLEREWLNFRNQISNIRTLKIPRWIQYSNPNHIIEIHGFSDASLSAYAAAVYICIDTGEDEKRVNLVSAKTKVAPVKTISLPRLELCGAVLLAKLLKYVLDALKIPNISVYAWSDSEIVLAWLRAHPSKWKTFVANRVSYIHERIGEALWRHVPSKENPADCATRGLLPSELQTFTLWWSGPKWLTGPKTNWPDNAQIIDTNMEKRQVTISCLQAETESMEGKYSSLTRLVRITAYCMRFKSKERGYLKAVELENALMTWIRKSQAEFFVDDIRRLQQGMKLNKASRLLKLTPFLDSTGLLRVGGRLTHSEVSTDEKHPMIIPDRCHITSLLIDKVHKDTLHGGPQLMMRVLAKRYWLMNARNAIRHHIHKCIPCFRQKANTQTQLMGHLPRPRVTMSRPFSHVGIDYCGPFDVKRYQGRGARTYKSYVAIFICMAVKAIHIEVVTDLTAQGFLGAFRRFASRRGLPTDVYCDCGTNFVGGYSILTRQKQEMISQLDRDIAALVEREGTTFHFIPPSSPHFGGLWESGVRSTKHHLKRILGTSILTYEELTTVLTQIEACLNSRPLCPGSNDPTDVSSLTPAHFLIGDIMLTPPERSVLDTNINRLDRWQYVQRLYQNFWKRWNSEYLCRLQQRPKWTQGQENLKVGDLVIVKEDNLPPSRWLLGRIVDTHPGTDNLVRVVTIKTKESVLKRPIAKTCLLPIENRNNLS